MRIGLYLGLGNGGAGISAAFSVSIGAGPFTTGATLTATVSGLQGGETVTYQWQDDGVDIAGATASTYAATIGTDSIADASAIRCEVTVDGSDPFYSGAREIRYAAGSVTESGLADWTIDDDALNVNLASDFTTTNLTGSYVITGLPSGAVDDGDGSISGTADGTPETASITATFTDQYGRTIVGSYSVDTVYRTQAVGGADLDLAFAEDSAIASTDLKANWTTNGNTLTYAITGTALPTGLSVSSIGVMTGTPTTITADATYTLRGTDEYGRTTDDTFTLEITAASSAPTIDTLTFTDNNDGTPASLGLTYTGDVTGYRIYIATGTASISVSAAQLYAGSGGTGTSEFADYAVGADIDITGLTATSESAVRISAALITSADGSDPSNVETVTVSGLDFTVPAAPTAATDVAGDTITLTFAEAIYGSQDTADFVFTGITAGTPTITGITGFGTSTLTIEISTNLVANGDTVTLAYTNTDSDLRDADGNNLANFASLAVTNNVPSASVEFAEIDQGSGSPISAFTSNASSTTITINIGAADADRDVVLILLTYDARGSVTAPTAVKETNSSGTDFTVISDGTNSMDYIAPSRCGMAGYELNVAVGTTMDVYIAFDAGVSRIGVLVLRKVGGTYKLVDNDNYTSPNTTDFSVSGSVVADDIVFAMGNYRTPSVGMTGITSPTAWGPEGDAQGEWAIVTETGSSTKTITETVNDGGNLNMLVVG